MMTTRITSDQMKQLERFTQDAVNRALKNLNLDKDGVQRLIERGGEFQAYVVAGISRFSAKAPDYSLARTILGSDFITPEEVAKARPSIAYTDEQITALVENLPSGDALKWCKDHGYALIPAPPSAISLLDVREIQPTHFYSKTGGWYAEQKFASEDKTSFGWLLIKKTPVWNSTGRDWIEQIKLLSALERVPNAAEMSWFITTYFEVRGIRLFESVYVRTSSLDSSSQCVIVDEFGVKGLYVNGCGDGHRRSLLGVSAGSKF